MSRRGSCLRCGGPREYKKHYCDACRIKARREVLARHTPKKKLADASWWRRHPDRLAVYRQRAKDRRYTGPKRCATMLCPNTFDNRRPKSRQKFCDSCARLFRTRAPWARRERRRAA